MSFKMYSMSLVLRIRNLCLAFGKRQHVYYVVGDSFNSETDGLKFPLVSDEAATELKMIDLYEEMQMIFAIKKFFKITPTLLFVLIATGSAMSLNNSSYLHIALTFGLTIATLVQAIGHISGGHINPAVTVAMMVTRKISIFRGILYVIAQMVGAMCGSAILKGITPDDIEGNLAADMIMPGVSVGAGFGVEFLITWQFVMTVFATTDPNRKDLMGSPALAIGISIAIGHLFAIGYTNCGMNPARSFGPAVVSGFWTDHWVFWVGPILGGVLAALQYEFLLAPSASVQRFKNYVTCRDDKADGIINVNQVTNPVNVEMTTETNISTS